MRRSLPLITLPLLALLIGGLTLGSPLSAEEKPRIKAVLSTPQAFIDDAKYLVVDLAREDKQWENNLLPSIEIFLLGVDYKKPVLWDILVNTPAQGDQPGYRYQPCIPIDRGGKELRTFLRENLNPIGIDERLKRRGGFYQLTGDVFEGWMRVVDTKTKDYACIAAKGFESDIPEDMPHPANSHADLLKRGYDVGLELSNTAAQADLRRSQAEDLLSHFMKDVERKPDETQAGFDFRKLSQQQKYEQMQRIYVEAEQFTIGWTTDVAKKRAEAEFELRAFPQTDLQGYLATMGTEPSRFAALTMPEDPVLGLRLNLPFDDFRRDQLNEWYPVAREAAKSSVDTSDDFSDAEKGPAKEASDLFFDMLVAGNPLGRLDLFANITATETGSHMLVSGVRATDGKAADQIVKLLPQVREGWKVTMDSETIGDTAIHKIDASAHIAKAMTDFFGPSGLAYVGTSPDVVWIAAGDGSLELLKSAIENATEGKVNAGIVQAAAQDGHTAEPPPAGAETFVDLKLQAGPLVSFSDELAKETGWSLTDSITIKPPGRAAGATGEGRGGLQPIDPAEMRGIIRRSLIDIQDRVTGVVRRSGEEITGKMTFDAGVLRSVGKIIAKVAEDNL